MVQNVPVDFICLLRWTALLLFYSGHYANARRSGTAGNPEPEPEAPLLDFRRIDAYDRVFRNCLLSVCLTRPLWISIPILPLDKCMGGCIYFMLGGRIANTARCFFPQGGTAISAS